MLSENKFCLYIDTFRYIGINDSFTQSQAQTYCSTFYNTGTLCQFKSEVDWIRIFGIINAEPNRHYWTGRVKGITNKPDNYGGNEKRCSAVKYDNRGGIEVSSHSCCEAFYFICQTKSLNVTRDEGMFYFIFCEGYPHKHIPNLNCEIEISSEYRYAYCSFDNQGKTRKQQSRWYFNFIWKK